MIEINLEEKFKLYKTNLMDIEKEIDIKTKEIKTLNEIRSELWGRLRMLQELANDANKTDE